MCRHSGTRSQGCRACTETCLNFYANFIGLAPRVAWVLGVGVAGLCTEGCLGFWVLGLSVLHRGLLEFLGAKVVGLASRVARVLGVGVAGLAPRVAWVLKR